MTQDKTLLTFSWSGNPEQARAIFFALHDSLSISTRSTLEEPSVSDRRYKVEVSLQILDGKTTIHSDQLSGAIGLKRPKAG